MVCNIMSGNGFDLGFMGGLGMAWLGMVIIFFLIVFARKWLGEEFGMEFNTIGAFAGGYVPYLIIVTLVCSYKWALAGGIVGFLVGGFLLGQFIGGGGGDFGY
jgi:hypothetical protein